MNTIFIGGSRHISRLLAEVKKRLDNVVASGHQVIVGDANGADKAVQKHLLDSHYDKVTVFCSGDTARNNLGNWHIRRVDPPKSAKGFQFYAAKDRQMAREADFGLMIWDGKSPGTVLNVLRLVQAGKISVLFNVPDKTAINIKSAEHWRAFLSGCSPALRSDIRERATPEEWASVEGETQPRLLDFLDAPSKDAPSMPLMSDEAVMVLNQAFASSDATKIMETLGAIARDRGMSQIARESGLARESLYRSLDVGGNPEFTTIMKVLSSIGLRLEVKMLESVADFTLIHGQKAG
jgi:probable addiction module antidote protein